MILGISGQVLESGFYGCQGVKIGGAVVSAPDSLAAVREVVGVEDLKARREREVFEDFAEAPAGDLGDAVNIARDPAGAV
ncbi:MAG: hypothetical protein ACO3GO_08365 [Terrimicrobiaceae bacterium]